MAIRIKREKLSNDSGNVQHLLEAQKREVFGRRIKKLRREGILPANISGKMLKSLAIQVPTKEFEKIHEEVGETGLVSLKVDGKSHPVLIHNIARDPMTDDTLHVDFLQVNLREKVTATVPLEFIGESPIEKSGEGIVVPQIREIEVEALPMDLPEKIVVDITGLAVVGDTIKVADLKVDRSKVELKEEDPERIVVNVEEPAKEEVVEAPPAEEVPSEGGAAPGEGAEGEAPAEGEKAEEQPKEGAKEEKAEDKKE